MNMLNREQALEALAQIDDPRKVLASIRTTGGRHYYAARNILEAQRWFSFNQGWYYMGSEKMEMGL